MNCTRCRSYAINHNHHGRDGSDGDLCDVCYWRKRAESSGWQPIETAPKDGTDILLHVVYGQSEILIGYFYSGDAAHHGFYEIDGDDINNPTHWMPLPEPPEKP